VAKKRVRKGKCVRSRSAKKKNMDFKFKGDSGGLSTVRSIKTLRRKAKGVASVTRATRRRKEIKKLLRKDSF